MARLTKDELLSKITEKIDNEDLALELLEDVSDSIEETGEINRLTEELNKVTNDYTDLKQKYKDRFMTNVTPVCTPEIEEPAKNYIDIREI